jgi:hypothetical protein
MNTSLADLGPSKRGSMVLLTERRRDFGPMTCEGCGLLHGGGHAHAAIVQESDDADTQWLLDSETRRASHTRQRFERTQNSGAEASS